MIRKITAIASLCLLTACASGEVRETLGLGNTAPDEFEVVSRPPLTVPPDFNLVPPEPGKQGPQHSTEAMAKSALFGKDSPAAKPVKSVLGDDALGHPGFGGIDADTNSEFTLEPVDSPTNTHEDTSVTSVTSVDMGSAATSNFLSKMGTDAADPEIRAKLGEDIRNPAPAKEEAGSLLEQLQGAEHEEPVVDPKGEAARLRANKDEGKKANEGEVVTEEKKKKSVLDRIW